MCVHSMQWKWLKLDDLIFEPPAAAKSDTLACASPRVLIHDSIMNKIIWLDHSHMICWQIAVGSRLFERFGKKVRV